MNRRHHLILVSVLAPVILSGIGFNSVLVMNRPPARVASSPVTIGGPFTLTAADGTTATDQTYRGKWLLVYFGYTFCPDTCPTALNEIAGVLERLGPDAAKLQPLFITVDPERDTPEVMGKYVDSFDPRIVGLTGSPQQIADTAKEYGVYYTPHKSGKDDGDYLIEHSSYIYIMDPRGIFVKAFDPDTPADRIAESLHDLLRQTSWRKGLYVAG
jgi:protein SCO1